MSKKPTPSKAPVAPPAGVQPAAGPADKPSLTCESCQSWFRAAPPGEADHGQCRAFPPSVPTAEFRPAGRLVGYPLTLSVLPACGTYRPRA